MRFEILESESQIRELIEWHNANSQYVVLDLETTDKLPRKAKLVDIQMSGYAPDHAVMFDGKFLPLLKDLTCTQVGQNWIRYDWKVAYLHGVDLRTPNVRDTLLLAHLDDENADHDLDSWVQENYQDDYKERFWEKYKSYTEAPEGERLQYSCKDILYTRRRYEDLLVRLDVEPKVPRFDLVTHVHRLALALFDTEIEGLRIDLPHLTQLGGELSRDIAKTEEELKQLGGVDCEIIELQNWEALIKKLYTPRGKKWQTVPKPEFNFGSGKDVQALLYDRLKLPVQTHPKTKKPTTDDGALETLAELHPVAAKLRDLRKFSKMRGAFIDGILDRAEDGRIYPSFNVNGTATGRISHSDPNMGQMPSRGDWSKIRGIFVPEPGFKLISADYCLPPDTEYLTPEGWRTADRLGALSVWQVSRDSLEGTFVKPSRVIWKEYSGEMVTYATNRGVFRATDNHRMLWVGQPTSHLPATRNYRRDSLSHEDVPNTACSFAHFSRSPTISSYSEQEIWIAALLQADGSCTGSDRYRVQLSEPRKVAKAENLLGPGIVASAVRTGHNHKVTTWKVAFSSPLLAAGKRWSLTSLGANQAHLFVEALEFWDGSYNRRKVVNTGRFSWFCTDERNVEEVQSWLVRAGYEAKKQVIPTRSDKHSQCYALVIKREGTTRVFPGRYMAKERYEGLVGCVTVPSSYILVRQGGQCFVTGNCQLEVCIAAHFSQDENLLKIINEGASQHDITAQSLGIERSLAKTLNFGMQYLCSPFKVKELLGCSGAGAELVWRKYWDTYRGLKGFIDETVARMERHGFVTTPFGRKRRFPGYARPKWADPGRGMYTKEMRQAFNAVIQGTGADITSQAFYLIAEWLKATGKGRAWFTVHDEVLVEAREEYALEVRAKLEETMLQVGRDIGLTVDLKVDASEPLDRWQK